ncbi:BrnT family toxin [Phormidium pseudopriestleyi FRX01]|uniref:BrnT family toxin n=2 Tax=Phormidium TaxID=1198 RepID=A0ABS3FML8_9CYAN|nr:BrnT family toxin [Phormidium pseudopriestleyi FRX01]
MNFWQNLVTICSNNQGMEFEWDETKRLTNLRKHGIDFIDVSIVFDGDIVTVEDDRFNYGEQRFVTFGLLQGRVVAVVHTEREECIRIISARKATKYEQQIYFEQLSN